MSFESDTYTWRLSTIESKKKIKWFIFSAVNYSYFDGNTRRQYSKRKQDDKDITKEVDLEYLQDYLKKSNTVTDTQEVKIGKIFGKDKKTMTFSEFVKQLSTPKKGEDELEDFDCLFFIFLTYLTTDGRIRVGEEDLASNEIVDMVKHLLPDRPKILLVQADDVRLLQKLQVYKGDDKTKPVIVKVPVDADILQIVSNVPGEFARYSNKNSPSFLIKTFCDVMQEQNSKGPDDSKDDLLSLTQDINQRIDAEIETIADIKKSAKEGELKEDLWTRVSDLEPPLVTSTLKRKLII